MAVVTLDFRPPIEPDIVSLHVFEGSSADGPWNEIDEVTDVGAYPTYITRYTTDKATNMTNWFAIQWENTLGGVTGLSAPLQGGFTPLVSEIVERVMLRDSTLDENVVAQEAEAVVEEYFPNEDLQTLGANEATAKQLSGLTLLTMARAYLGEILKQTAGGAAGNVSSFTAGLVSISGGTTTTTSGGKSISIDVVERIVKSASAMLGRSYSTILLLEEVSVAGGYMLPEETMDETRLLFEIQ